MNKDRESPESLQDLSSRMERVEITSNELEMEDSTTDSQKHRRQVKSI